MKTLLATCVALLTLTASAVTIDWNEDVDWGNIQWRVLTGLEDGHRDISHIGPTTKTAYRLNIRFPTCVPTSGCLLMLGGTVSGTGGYGITLSATSNGLMASLKDENHTANFTGSGTLVVGLNQIVVAVDRNNVSENYAAAISIFINGKECLTYEGRLGGVTFNQITVGRGYETGEEELPMDGVTYNGRIASSTNLTDNYTGSDDIRKAYARTLPEPTSLALLMLGVGAVALRRKVA